MEKNCQVEEELVAGQRDHVVLHAGGGVLDVHSQARSCTPKP